MKMFAENAVLLLIIPTPSVFVVRIVCYCIWCIFAMQRERDYYYDETYSSPSYYASYRYLKNS